MTLAEKFNTKNYITDVDNYKNFHPAHSYNSVNHLVKYEITFIDGSKRIVIMTSRQRDALNRTKQWETIKHTGGLGYQKLISE